MFTTSDYNSKILLQVNKGSREIFEPSTRKLGGVWTQQLNGWLFDKSKIDRINDFIVEQNSIDAEEQNKEYYTKFSHEPNNYNTPSSRSNSSGGSENGLHEAFDLIQELFDRVSDLEKITEELGKKIKR